MSVRIVNTHPTEAFEIVYNSCAYLFQPKKGVWRVTRKSEPAMMRDKNNPNVLIPNPKAPPNLVRKLERVKGKEEEVAVNYHDVPEDFVNILMGPKLHLHTRPKLDEKGEQVLTDNGDPVMTHYLRRLEDVAGQEAKALTAEIETKRKVLAELELQERERKNKDAEAKKLVEAAAKGDAAAMKKLKEMF